MKISKLFHWLYATLMFLPFIFFVPTLIYYGFNEHATAQDVTIHEPVYYESNAVDNVSDLIDDNIYHLSLTPENNPNAYFIFNVKSFYNNRGYLFANGSYSSPSTAVVPYLRTSNNPVTDYLLFYEDLGSSMGTAYVYAQTFEMDFVFTSVNDINYLNLLIPYISYTDFTTIKSYVDVTYTMSITDSVNFSWQSIWTLPLFSWTSNSFISQPFTYITGLFGMQPSNTFNNVATYFVTISICWLVFDVLMYIPNLAHRWLDRGAIQ